MSDLKRKDATRNAIADFQRKWGSYRALCQDNGIKESTAQAWRIRYCIPEVAHWDVAMAAYKRGFYRTHYAALEDLHQINRDAAIQREAAEGLEDDKQTVQDE